MKVKSLIALMLISVFAFGMHCGPKPVIQPPPPPPPPPVVVDTTPPPPPPPPPKPELKLSAIYFDFDKYDIRSDAREILAQNSQGLTDHSTATIKIEGNCDERGTDEYNLALGQKRADAAKNYLVNYGVDAARISTVSYGESSPVDRGHNEDAWSKNRRDDFIIVSEQK